MNRATRTLERLVDRTTAFLDRLPVRRSTRPGIAIALVYLALVLPTLPTVGLTWDEPIYMTAAKAYWSYYYHVVTGADPLSPQLLELWTINNEHPPLVKSLSAVSWGIATLLAGGDLGVMASLTAHRLPMVLLTAVGVVAVYDLGRDAYGPIAGGVAALSLVFMPRFFAHSRYLALDVPMAITWLMTVWACWRATTNWRYGVLAGVVYGLALSTKLNAFFVPVAVGVWALVAYRDVIPYRMRSYRVRLLDARGRALLASAIVAPPLVVVLSWPWLWTDTVESLLFYVEFHLDHFPIPLYYMGEFYPADGPWHYPFVMTAVTVPLSILALSIVGTVRCVRDTVTLSRRASFLFVINAFVPLFLIAMPSHAYDGTRLFMPAFPFVALLAGVGAAVLLDRTRELASAVDPDGGRLRRWIAVDPERTRRAVAAVVVVLVVLPGGYAYVADDPNQNVYFNAAVGGEQGAVEKGFEYEYWQQSYLDVVPWLNERADEPVRIFVPIGGEPFEIYRDGDVARFDPHRVYLPPSVSDQEGILDENVEIVHHPSEADYVVFITRQGAFDDPEWGLFENEEPVYTHEVGGAPVVQVYDADDALRHQYSVDARGSATGTHAADPIADEADDTVADAIATDAVGDDVAADSIDA